MRCALPGSRGQLPGLLSAEVLVGSKATVASDCRVAGMKGVVGLMKLFLPVWLRCGR